MLLFLHLVLLEDPVFTYDTKLEINIFNPQIMIHYDQTYEFLPIDFTYKDKTNKEITVEGVYIHNSASCVGGDENGAGCITQNPQFIIEGNVIQIVANTSIPKLLNRDSVAQVQLDMYAGAKQLTYTPADYQYFVSSIYKECILTKNADYDPTDTSSFIKIYLSDPYFRIPTKIYEYVNVYEFEFIQTSYCTQYHTNSIQEITKNTGNVYFATYGILQLLDSNSEIPTFSQLRMKLSNETQAMDYITPFSINFTEVKVEYIDIVHSIVYGRQFDKEINNVYIDNIEIKDTGYHHVYENLCIMLLQDADRNSVIYIDGSEESVSFTIVEIKENGKIYYTPGLICGKNIQFRPLDMIKTDEEDQMREICNLNNEENRNLDFVQEYCSDYVFIGQYVIYLTTILCGFCAICISTYIVNQIYILKIPFGRDFETYLIAIVMMAICVINAIVIILCSNPIPVIIPGVGTIALMMYNYLLTTETEYYNLTILTKYEIYKYKERLQVTAWFVISIILATLIQSTLSIFEIILAMSDVFQMLQFFKIDVDQAENSMIIYPSIVILKAIDSILNISSWLFLPFLILYFGLQYITRSQWFIEKLPQIPGNATKYIFDWRGFGIKICFTFFKFYCNFVGLIMCNYMNLVFNLETGPSVANVVSVFIFSCYLYSFSKFSMIPQWGKCLLRTLRAFYADCGILTLLFCDVIFSLVGCIVGPFYILKSKEQDRRKAYTGMWLWFLKTFGFLIMQPVLMFMRLAIFALYPCFIFLSEFVPPYFFIIQAMGIIPHQEEINNVYNDMVTESLPSVILRFLTYIFSYMIISLVIFVQQDLTSWYKCQLFSIVFIAVIFQRYWSSGTYYFYRTVDKYFRNYTLIQWHKFAEQRLQLILETMYQHTNFRFCTMDFQNIQADYSTDVEYIESYLQDQLMNCYQFIPGIGPLLGIVAEYMNGPPLVAQGTLHLSGIFFFNFLHFGSAIGMIMCYVNNPDSYIFYVLLGIYVLCQVLDAYDEAVEITNHVNIGFQRLFPCFQKVRAQLKNTYYAKRRIQLNSDLVNQIYLQEEILQKMKIDGTINMTQKYPSISLRLHLIRKTKLEQAKIDTEIATLRRLGADEDISKLQRKVQIMEDRMNEVIQLKNQINNHIDMASLEEGDRQLALKYQQQKGKKAAKEFSSDESPSYPGSRNPSIFQKIPIMGQDPQTVIVASVDDNFGDSQLIEDV